MHWVPQEMFFKNISMRSSKNVEVFVNISKVLLNFKNIKEKKYIDEDSQGSFAWLWNFLVKVLLEFVNVRCLST